MRWLTWLACGTALDDARPEVSDEVVTVAERAAAAVLAAPKAGIGAMSEAKGELVPPPFEPIAKQSGVGLIGHETSRKQLERAVGKDHVVDHRFDQGEGIFLPGVKVMPGTPYELNLQTDGETIERIEIVGGAIALDNGVRVGSTLAELRTTLGPFEMFGFGWDHGGTLIASGFEPPGFEVAVQTQPADPKGHTFTPKGLEVLRGGDQRFPSTHPGLDEIEPRVTSITLVWRDASDAKGRGR